MLSTEYFQELLIVTSAVWHIINFCKIMGSQMMVSGNENSYLTFLMVFY